MSDSNNFTFYPCSPKEWNGRYKITKSNENVFHLKYNQNLGQWWPTINFVDGFDTGYCPAVDMGNLRELANSVNSVKNTYHFSDGGSFLINEFGQVIVPTIGDGRVLVGEIDGKILFENVFNGGIIDLSDTNALSFGDPWTLPYIGIPYNYDPNGGILFQEKKGSFREFATKQDSDLNNKLYRIRNGDYCRFIVNPWGVVLTKKPPYLYGGQWESAYVGNINYNMWFDKEE